MSQAPQDGKPPTSTLAIVGLILAFCAPVLGFFVSIVAIIRIGSSKGALGGQVLAIVGIVLSVVLSGMYAAIAIPSFVQFGCRSKQSEAKGNLRSLFVTEESFKGDHNAYSADLAALQFAPHAQRYTYAVTSATPTAFTAEARGKDDMAGDTWTIDQTGVPNNVASKCGGSTP